MLRSRSFALSAVAAASLLALSSPAEAKRCVGITMPDEITVEGETLVLNGMGVREATIFNVDVYVAGLYLPEASTDGAAILASEGTKRLVLRFVRDVDGETMAEAIQDAFGNRQAASVARLTGMLPEQIADGSTLTFTYREGSGLEVKIGGNVAGTIAGAGFARTFFGIWIGNRPPNRGLKRGLLGGRCG